MPYLPCSSCGIVRHTRPDALFCVKCITKKRRDEFAAESVARLDARNYTVHSDLTLIKNNKDKVEVTNRECGCRYKVQLCNLLSGASKCSVCGPKKRAANALKHYIAKHGRDYDLTLWEDYLTQVRQLSDRCYEANIDVLNPKRLPRSRPDLNPDAVNLDHIVPIIECFKRGWDIHEAAALSNLQLLPARENLSKKQTFDASLIDLSDRPAMEWINDGVLNRFVKVETLDDWVAKGWQVGQLESRVGKHLVGKVWVTDGVANKRHSAHEALPIGWRRGRTLDQAVAKAKRKATWDAKHV